jgi:ATP-dependent protease HslVU (ClpYQ) peptidase subunit
MTTIVALTKNGYVSMGCDSGVTSYRTEPMNESKIFTIF